MKRLLFATAAAALYAGTALTPAAAAPIAAGSELSLNGSDSFVATATNFTITFTNPANIGGTTGSFATAFGPVPPAINGVVTMISTLSDTSTNFQLYSATVGAVTSTLTAGTITAFQFVPGAVPSLDIEGTGTLNLTGFTSVAGDYTLTSQGGATNVTFSETAVASAPEPNTLVLIGTAIGFLGLIRLYGPKRRKGDHGGLAA